MGVDMYLSGLEIKICDIYIYVKVYVMYGNFIYFYLVVFKWKFFIFICY